MLLDWFDACFYTPLQNAQSFDTVRTFAHRVDIASVPPCVDLLHNLDKDLMVFDMLMIFLRLLQHLPEL